MAVVEVEASEEVAEVEEEEEGEGLGIGSVKLVQIPTSPGGVFKSNMK